MFVAMNRFKIVKGKEIEFGIQKKIFGFGQSQKRLNLLTEMLNNIKIYILVLRILRVSKKFYKYLI